VSGDGTLAAIQEPSKVTIVGIPGCARFAGLSTDPLAVASEVAWVGTPPRLLVLSRFAAHSVAHLVEPFGPRSLAEIRIESPMRLYASVGNAALALGPTGTAMIVASDQGLALHPLPSRSVPACAGASGTQFVVAQSDLIEEWDPQSRMPRRRLKLPRPATITAVGGSERVVWMTTQQEPSRIDVIPFVNRGQPKAHDLPEPISMVASHPRSDVIACIGVTSGRVYVVDLDGRAGLRVVGPQGIDRAEAVGIVLGRVVGVLAAQANHPGPVVTRDRRVASGASAPPSGPTAVRSQNLFGSADDVEETPTTVTLATPLPESRPVRAASPPPIGNPMPAVTKLQSPGPPKPDPEAEPLPLFSGASAPRVAPPTRASQTGFDETVLPPMSSTPAQPASAFAVPTRPSRPSCAAPPRPSHASIPPPLSPAPPTSSSDARAIDDTLPPPSFGMPPSIQGPSAAIGAGPSRPADTRRGVAETIPVVKNDERRDYFTAFRESALHPRARTAEPIASVWSAVSAGWRDELLVWARSVDAGQVDAVDGAAPLEQIATRYDVSFALVPALAWLYGQHLLGRDGGAPAELAQRLGAGWDEALGRGDLARRGVTTFAGSRVRLADVVLRALDEAPPLTGTVVGAPGVVSLLGPCTIVAAGPLTIIAEACLPSIGGAILAANADVDPAELAREARAYGAAPLWRVKAEQLSRVPSEQPIILVADDDVTADLLGVPRLT